MNRLLPCLVLLAIAIPALAQTTSAGKPKTMAEILQASAPSDWRRPDPANLLYMDIPGGRVVIELAPEFAPRHVENIRKLAKSGYFDGLSINRSQDNFVVQWGDANGEDPSLAKSLGDAETKLPAEFTRIITQDMDFHRLPDVDGWAPQVGFAWGMPAARSHKTREAWLTHCYGMVGAGRGGEADSSNGSELYVVIGQSPRQLDRNITPVGRVVYGMEQLSILPRGTGPLGFYEKAEQRTPITRVRLASEVPEADRMKFELLRTNTATFDALVESRRNRRDDWYLATAGHIDLCNVPLPIRPVAE
jgi:peptidylprolyl isomerase